MYYSDYGNSSHVNTQTATFVNPPNGAPQRWKVTTLDRFGRAIQVDSGSGAVSLANTVSRVQTQYAPCACSPLLKLWRTSLPYNPNSGSPVWTTYTYDASGRTIAVTAPDGNSTTNYTYAGNSTTVTDPAGKWKTQTKDSFGNLTLVTEPNPAGGANFTTSYTYSPLNQLVSVSMPRNGTTQTRTFTYNGQDLTSAANPENGTVSFTYDAAHRVLTRTDAKNQQTLYTYNSLGQVTQVTHGTLSGGTFTPDTTSGVTYSYDTYGRTSQVAFGAADLNFARSFTYNYTYNQANRILTQTMGWNMYVTNASGSPSTQSQSYGVSYQWDNEGKMTSYNDLVNDQFVYQYDGMGRATGLNDSSALFNGAATFGAANQLLTLSYGYGTSYPTVDETRSYNSLLQLTEIKAPWVSMDMQYNYPANNNGRIASSTDVVHSQTVNYTYDSLNRLTAAQTTNGGWGESYTYDGFGNLSAIGPTGQGGETWSAVINESTNRMTGVNYDANGNQIGDQVYTNYVWNGENRMVQQLTAGSGGAWYGGTAYSYDPSGRRVLKNANPDPAGTNGSTGYSLGSWEFYFYGLNGRKMGTIDCDYASMQAVQCFVTGQDVYFAGKLVAEKGNPVTTDRLGSVRANGLNGNLQYFPYGAEQTGGTEGSTKFATYFRDALGQDYAEQRYYNAGMGRFWSPDPTAGNTANPGSMNKYAYVQGDPINFTDPRGLDPNCGPGMAWDGEGCTNATTGLGDVGSVGGPCGQNWMTDASLQGPCQVPCSGYATMPGEDYLETAGPACQVPQGPAASAPAPSCSITVQPSGTPRYGSVTSITGSNPPAPAQNQLGPYQPNGAAGGVNFAVEVQAILSGNTNPATWLPLQISSVTSTYIGAGGQTTTYDVSQDDPAPQSIVDGQGYLAWFDFPGASLPGQYSTSTLRLYSTVTYLGTPPASCSVAWTVTIAFNNGAWSVFFNGQPVKLNF